MQDQLLRLRHCLENGFTPFHVNELIKKQLIQNGYLPVYEESDWTIERSGKYFVERDGSLIAFCIDGQNPSFKIAAAHVDACALKLKDNFLIFGSGCTKLNVETYGGGIWYSFFDRPLKIAGRVVYEKDGAIVTQTVQSPYCIQIPSVAIHFNRDVNDKFSVNPQIDLLPLLSATENVTEEQFWQSLGITQRVLGHDLYIVSAEKTTDAGLQGELVSSPRIDNLTSVQAIVDSLISHNCTDGVCVGAFFNHEEVGSNSSQGASGDFLENTLRRIAYALGKDETGFFKAMANSFLLSVDNAHAVHPNHPEKSDITNKTTLGGGIVIKSHAKQAYATSGVTSAVLKTIFEKANVPYQTFYNRSDIRSGATLGNVCMSRFGVHGADIGLAQLAMHSACECFAKADYTAMINGVTAFYSSPIAQKENTILL